MACVVKTLFDITLDFIALHADFVDSLEKFPLIIGESLFERCVELGVLKNRDRNSEILKLFVDAYPNDVMASMRIVDGLVFINEHLGQLTVMMKYLRSLDLSCCGLGSSHETIGHIGSLQWLENLSLRQNYLSDESIRKIALPIHVFGYGPTELKHLDLSDNHLLGDKIVVFLSWFKQIKYLNLTGSSITNKGCEMLKQKCSLYPCENAEFERMPIITKGWAKLMLEGWADIIAQRQRERITKRVSRYRAPFRDLREVPFVCTRFHTNFIFKKFEDTAKEHPASELDKKQVALNITKEDDFFNQYR